MSTNEKTTDAPVIDASEVYQVETAWDDDETTHFILDDREGRTIVALTNLTADALRALHGATLTLLEDCDQGEVTHV